jgi:hypothetical protein
VSDIKDIRDVQSVRPDLTDNQADEVIGFLMDTFDEDPYTVDDNRKLFEAAADMIFPEDK